MIHVGFFLGIELPQRGHGDEKIILSPHLMAISFAREHTITN